MSLHLPPRPLPLFHRERKRGGERSRGDPAPSSFNDTEATITPLPKCGSGARGESGPQRGSGARGEGGPQRGSRARGEGGPQRGSRARGEGGPQRGSGARGESCPLGSGNVRRMAE